MLAAAAIAGCMVFPASSPWNQRVDGAPPRPGSDAMVHAVGLDDPVHPDFGSGGIGIPFQIVARNAKKPETRERRLEQFVELLASGGSLH